MKVVSIYASHDGAVTYIDNNKVVFHTQLDRYNRFKHSALPTKEIINELEKLDIDLIIMSHADWHNHAVEWNVRISESKKLKNIEYLNYGSKYHHLFHAYCVLTWNKNQENIIVVDGTGATINDGYERESFYKFKNNELQHVITEQNMIGYKYQTFTDKHFEHPLECGKTMAWSLYDEKPAKVQEEFEVDMDNLIHEWNIDKNLSFTGGCAQNVLYNSDLSKIYEDLFCDPFNGDFGISLGAANYYLKNNIRNNEIYLGLPQDISIDLFLKHDIIDVTNNDVAEVLTHSPVAIFQSRSEQGQRGLGNRSLLMSPLLPTETLNDIKKREWFRPFACSILHEESKNWFDMTVDESPYMMYVFNLKDEKKDMLKCGLSKDNKSRIQTVKETDNKNYYDLLKSWYQHTNLPILVNTSLNLPGEVAVETMHDLYSMFERSKLNYIYLPEIKKLIKKR